MDMVDEYAFLNVVAPYPVELSAGNAPYPLLPSYGLVACGLFIFTVFLLVSRALFTVGQLLLRRISRSHVGTLSPPLEECSERGTSADLGSSSRACLPLSVVG